MCPILTEVSYFLPENNYYPDFCSNHFLSFLYGFIFQVCITGHYSLVLPFKFVIFIYCLY